MRTRLVNSVRTTRLLLMTTRIIKIVTPIAEAAVGKR
jgi:hypothetical protein